MNKRKLLLVALSLCMVAILAMGGTLAYLTDTDMDVNVMVVGKVTIVQNETDRDGNAYVDGQKLVPAVIPGELSYDYYAEEYNLNVWGESVNNEIDKFISVTNTGSEYAYIRTIVLMENNTDNSICEKIHGLWNNNDGQYRKWIVNADGTEAQVEINGVTYSVAVCTYESPLAPGKTSTPSLCQVFLDPTADNAWTEMVAGEDNVFSIIAFSQAVQAQGFENAETALDEAFGEVTAANVLGWYNEINAKKNPEKTTDINNIPNYVPTEDTGDA